MRTWLIEDNPDDAHAIEAVFRRLGCAIEWEWLPNARRAIERLNQLPEGTAWPDLLLLDLRLPGLSGIEFLEWLQLQEHSSEVIVLTGGGNRLIERAYALGAAFYLTKPLNSEVLYEVLAFGGLLALLSER